MRIKISNHNAPGAAFVTPHGTVRTDEDGYANVSAEQLAHLKSHRGLQIATGDMPTGSLATRDVPGRKRRGD